MIEFQNVVDGRQVPAGGGERIESFDPATGAVWATIPRCNAADVDAAVGAARAAYRSAEWGGLSASARGALLYRFADVLASEADRLAEIETCDNGKLIAEMRAQVNYLPAYYRYFAGLADKVEGRVLSIEKPTMHAFTRREPLGVIACITAISLPLSQVSISARRSASEANTSAKR